MLLSLFQVCFWSPHSAHGVLNIDIWIGKYGTKRWVATCSFIVRHIRFGQGLQIGECSIDFDCALLERRSCGYMSRKPEFSRQKLPMKNSSAFYSWTLQAREGLPLWLGSSYPSKSRHAIWFGLIQNFLFHMSCLLIGLRSTKLYMKLPGVPFFISVSREIHGPIWSAKPAHRGDYSMFRVPQAPWSSFLLKPRFCVHHSRRLEYPWSHKKYG
jgi:hypothetical protein